MPLPAMTSLPGTLPCVSSDREALGTEHHRRSQSPLTGPAGGPPPQGRSSLRPPVCQPATDLYSHCQQLYGLPRVPARPWAFHRKAGTAGGHSFKPSRHRKGPEACMHAWTDVPKREACPLSSSSRGRCAWARARGGSVGPGRGAAVGRLARGLHGPGVQWGRTHAHVRARNAGGVSNERGAQVR